MRFLCQAHRDLYSEKTDDTLTEKWFEWMFTAGDFYASSLWHKAVPFAGCAFDIAKLRLGRPGQTNIDSITQLTLSAIYLSNIFEHLECYSETRNIRQLALESIDGIPSILRIIGRAESATCKRNLCNPINDDKFIQQYLNLPFVHYEQTLRLQMVFH